MVAIPCVVKESLTMAQAGFVEHLLDPMLQIRLAGPNAADQASCISKVQSGTLAGPKDHGHLAI